MANQPSFIPSAWAANNSTTETIPATTTESGKASWDQGFPVETSLPLSEGGIPPKYGDFNGILNVLSQFCLFAQSGGQYTWNSTLSYSVGSIVVGSDGSIYRAVQATTNVNPVGDTSGKWERIVSKSDIDALEADIQTAMSDAANAVSNASAAQSAVSTLDANVVKLSGNQTVGGVKKFTSNVTIDGNIVRSANTGEIRLSGGTDASTVASGASLSLYGSARSTSPGTFILAAGTSTTVYSRLIGQPNGTLQWGGKDIITAAGGTMTGELVRNGNLARSGVTNDVISVFNGSAAADGAGIWLYGNSVSGNNSGVARLQTYDGTNYHSLNLQKNGTLVHDNKGFVYDSGAQTIAGTKTFTSHIKMSGAGANTINRTDDDSVIYVCGASSISNGAFLAVSGKDRSTNAGTFSLRAISGTYKDLIGKPDGTLTWNGQSIQTSSDERLKTPLANVPDAVLDAWGAVGWGQFQYLDAVEAKGADKARLHLGLIAQHVKTVFEERGLDACVYGILCHEEHPATDEEPAVDLWMVRYTEAAAMEAAYQRRRADRAEARITALEQRLAEMEAAIASLISPVGDETYAEPEQEQEENG